MLLSSCQYWDSLLQPKTVEMPEETWAAPDQSSQKQHVDPEPSIIEKDEPLDIIIKDEPVEETPQDLLYQNMSDYLATRVQQFNEQFHAHLGLLVFQQDNRTPVYSYHADDCFIPASLTKVVVCSALMQMLQSKHPYDTIADAFQREKSLISWNHSAFTDINHLLTQINTYTFHQAPRANRIANALGDFLLEMYANKHHSTVRLEDVLVAHLDQISFVSDCNRFENASGLTLNNRLTPFQVADCMYHLKAFPEYYDSLMSAGQGTLENRLHGLDFTHRFKTGSLKNSGVLCLAGYLDLMAPVGFVVVVNELPRYLFLDCQAWVDETVVGLAHKFFNKECSENNMLIFLDNPKK
jgi:D-alanyl-D-alanine carboxypeptidase